MNKQLIMKKTLSLCIGLILAVQSTSAQTLTWAKQIGADAQDQGRSIAVDASGSIYTTGTFSDTVDFDPGIGTYFLTSTGLDDVFISKLDSLGNFMWAGSWGWLNFDLGLSITVDTNGFVYSTGLFQGTADFDPGVGVFNLTASGLDGFVVKMDASTGSLVWAKQLPFESSAIAVDPNGNVITVGRQNGSAFLSKLDASGNPVWTKEFATQSGDCGASSLVLDALGNIYTTGFFIDTVDFDPGLGTYNLVGEYYGDAFICKLDAGGNFQWAKQLSGNGNEYGATIALDASGNVYTSGVLNATADFDPGVGTYNLSSAGIGNSDGYISKLNSSGDFVWAKQLGGAIGSSLFISSIVLGADNNVYSIGNFSQTVDFDPGTGTNNLTSSGPYDVFISKLDNNGNFISTLQFAGSGFAEGRSLVLDNVGNIFATGNFKATTDFDPLAGVFNLTSNGADDIFIIKLQNELENTTSINEHSWTSKINLYPNPTTSALSIESDKIFENANIIVRNAIGQEIFSDTYSSTNNITFTLDGESGVYFIEINDTGKVAILKVIKD
jgi:hypothetical protein